MREDINSPRNVYVYEPISEDDPEERTIVDIMPHIGSFIFRGFVRRVGKYSNLFKFYYYSIESAVKNVEKRYEIRIARA